MGRAHGEAGQKGLSCLDSFSVSISIIRSPGAGDRNRDEDSLSVETFLDPRGYIDLNNLKGSWRLHIKGEQKETLVSWSPLL